MSSYFNNCIGFIFIIAIQLTRKTVCVRKENTVSCSLKRKAGPSAIRRGPYFGNPSPLEEMFPASLVTPTI
jgi:hypothetical protein